MAQAGFLQALEQFQKDNINEEMVELLEPYINSPDYTMAVAKRVQTHFISFFAKIHIFIGNSVV